MRKPFKFLNLFFFVAFCIVFVSILLFAFYGDINSTGENTKDNTPVISKKDILDDNVVALHGKAEFYWKQLLTPEEFQKGKKVNNKSIVDFPDTWNKRSFDGKRRQGTGYATYRISLYIDTVLNMAVKIKDYCNSYRMWINGELVSEKGFPGKNRKETIPAKINTISEFTSKKGLNELIIQTANYHENYGGFREEFLIGSKKKISRLSVRRKIIDAFVLGIILIMAIYNIGLFFLNQHKKSFLFFGLFAFFVFLRQALLSDIHLFDSLIQANLPLYLKITFASAVFSSLMLGLLFRSVFPELLSKFIIKAFSFYIILTGIFIFIAPIYYVSVGMHFIQAVIVLFLLYILFLSIKAFYLKLTDRYILAMGFFIVLITTGVEFLIFNRVVYAGYTLHYGLVMFILFQSYALSAEFSLTNKRNIWLSNELNSYNINLEKLVSEKTRDAVRTEERKLFSVILQKTETDNLLSKIYSDLKKMRVKSQEEKKIIKELINKVSISLKQNETEKHLMHFEKIHPDFFNALKAAHPSLSQNEMKLSAYIKLNMSHKDIGRILSVQPESVRKAKTRMRQKMGLASDKEIINYLNNF